MSGGGGPDVDTTAQDMYAAVNREMWADYQKRFVPTENSLMEYALDSSVDDTMADKAKSVTESQYSLSTADALRDAARYGGMTGDQRAAFDSQSKISASLGSVDNMNKVREYSKDTRNQILSSMVNLGRETKSDALGGLSQSASLESSRNNTNSQLDAQNDANMMSTAGTLASLAILAI